MATTVKTRRKFDRLSPSLEFFARTMEGLPIPKKLLSRLKKDKRAEETAKARKAKSKAKRRKHASSW